MQAYTYYIVRQINSVSEEDDKLRFRDRCKSSITHRLLSHNYASITTF